MTNAFAPYTLVFLYTTYPPEVSGSALYNWERVQWLARQGTYRIVVFAPDCQDSSLPDSSIWAEALDQRSNLLVERYPSKPWLLYPTHYAPTPPVISQLNRRLVHYQPDMIVLVDVERFFLFSTWRLPGVEYAKTRQIPYLTEYQTDYYNFSSAYPGGKWVRDFTLRPITRHLYHKFDYTLVTSRFAQQNLLKMGVTNSHILSFVGKDLSPFRPERRDRRYVAPWLAPEENDHQLILYLGRLSHEKRVDCLIREFAQLKQSYPKCSLLIAGAGPSDVVRRLKSLATKTPHIHFLGFLHGEQKANVLASCDIFCSLSPFETLGLAILEAMASGTPVVTVDSGAVPEYLHHQVNGYLVPTNGPCHPMLQTLLTHPAPTVTANALNTAQNFTLEAGCKRLHQFYLQILKARQPNSTATLEKFPLLAHSTGP